MNQLVGIACCPLLCKQWTFTLRAVSDVTLEQQLALFTHICLFA